MGRARGRRPDLDTHKILYETREDMDWQGLFFRVGLSMGFSNLGFLGQISSGVFEGRLQRPSPCLIRSVPGRERVRG